MRLFIGVGLSGAAKDALLRVQELMMRAGSGWAIDPALFHITLCFLGETPEAQVPSLQSLMREAALGNAPIDIRLTRAAVLGRAGRGVAVVLAESSALHSLQSRLSRALEDAGYNAERRAYKPHVTLGRDFALRDAAALEAARLDTCFTAHEMTLFESVRISGRLVYRPVCAAALGNA